MKPLSHEEVTFNVQYEPDNTEVRGNAIASDDERYDRMVEDKILQRLNDGDVWHRLPGLLLLQQRGAVPRVPAARDAGQRPQRPQQKRTIGLGRFA
jgi:hypothetical protein